MLKNQEKYEFFIISINIIKDEKVKKTTNYFLDF